ncbi:MAG: NUDIX domain-containing protein [Verrucomicrobia bacterium]|nr:NUDIX domain-containing protein [Verrucomicrobiota bacterium]
MSDPAQPLNLPHKVSTLLYVFDEADRVLLMERAQEPNLGLWSPCGGKLNTGAGESPHDCARREALEEMGLRLEAGDLHLTGIISEAGYQGSSHWLMFLFEVLPRQNKLPPTHREGRFQFFSRQELEGLPMPPTDRDFIWPTFFRHRGGFFVAHCTCLTNGSHDWRLEEGRTGFSA